jgi:transmembrane sensor
MSEASDPLSREVKAEAAAWLARLRADDRTPADEEAFQAWLAAAPAHTAAFEAVSSVWDIAGGLPRDLRGYKRQPMVSDRRQILAGLGVLVVAGGTFSAWRSAQARVYQTDVGEQKHVVLEDGSQVFLDTNTRINVKIDDTVRNAELMYGRADFNVFPDSSRQFIVSAADRKIVTGASEFDVQQENGRVSILLIKGSASLQSVSSAERTQVMRTGERLVTGQTGTSRLDRPNLAPLQAWRTGRAIFENDRLSQAIFEMNRYSTDKLEIENPAIADMRVSGVYYVGDNVAFASSISKLLPVKMRRDRNHVYLSVDSARLIQG